MMSNDPIIGLELQLIPFAAFKWIKFDIIVFPNLSEEIHDLLLKIKTKVIDDDVNGTQFQTKSYSEVKQTTSVLKMYTTIIIQCQKGIY
jgi:hypothetical protein